MAAAYSQRWPDPVTAVRSDLEKNFPNERWRLFQGTAEAGGSPHQPAKPKPKTQLTGVP